MKKFLFIASMIALAVSITSCGASRHGQCPANSPSGVYRSL